MLLAQAHRILSGGSLEEKLAVEPVEVLGGAVREFPERPARAESLQMLHGHERLPRLAALKEPKARALCLHRFANHELQAVEMFAWAILKFQDMPETFLRGLWAILVEEQTHFKVYAQRMAAYGMTFGDVPLSGNFWDQAPLIQSPIAFVCSMGLTFENANLDYALLYRDAFRLAGAEEDAKAMELVHHDELGHVAWGLSWLRRLKNPGESDVDAYKRVTPFPLGLHRAKGRNFTESARRKAGMDEGFISAIRDARAPMEESPRPRS